MQIMVLFLEKCQIISVGLIFKLMGTTDPELSFNGNRAINKLKGILLFRTVVVLISN